MFLGEFQHTIDAKGRLAIPAKYRGRLERGAVLVRGIEQCLYVYTMETWEAKARELDSRELDPRQRRMIERRFFGTAFECELDAQGRIVVPARFRTYAELSGETTILGARDRFEIWNTARWETYQDEMATEDLAGLDLPF
jgi:MraZ protein